MASSGTTTIGSVEAWGDANDKVVPNDGSTGVRIINWGGGRVDIWATSISGREDASCSGIISLVDPVTSSWQEEEILTNGTEDGGGAGGVAVKDLGWD